MTPADAHATSERPKNPWLVAVAVVVPTFMEVLDTTIANVALRYISGGLSAPVVDSQWVITSYLAANAVVLPITGWLSARFGRRRYFLFSIALFTISSLLCGLSTNLPQLILFRAMQGMAGGGLQPSSQAVLLDAFPIERQGAAMTMFGVAALFGPIIGPTLGGWLTDNYSWRANFLINVPVGAVAFAASYFLLQDPPYLKARRADMLKRHVRFDGIGFSLLVLVMVSWETMLSKGQQWDWLGDPFYRVQTLLGVVAIGLACLVGWEMTRRDPVINFRVLTERNFLVCTLTGFCAFGVLYGSATSLPLLLQQLLGYDAFKSGLVMSPSGIFALLVMPVVGYLIGRGMDARWLVATGLVVISISNFCMAKMNLEIDPWHVVWPRIVMTGGLSMVFAPLNVAAYIYVPPHLRGAAVGLLSLLRNEGGSVGTSLAETFQQRRDQFHTLRLGETLDRYDPATRGFLTQARQMFLDQTGDPAGAEQMAVASLDAMRHEQSLSMAYFDDFWLFAIVGFALVPLVLAMKRSVAEKGAAPAGH